MTSPLYTQYLMDKYGVAWFKFDETSGNVTDSKGSAVGVTTGGVTRATGWNGEGSALNFDGTSGYVSFNEKVIPVGAVSIRMKIRMDSPPTAEVSDLVSNVFSYGDFGIRSFVSTNGNISFVHARGIVSNPSFQISAPFIFDNNWHDVVFTWDGTTNANSVKLYIDNMITPVITLTSLQSNSTVGSYNLRLGNAASGTSPRYLKGQLDNLEIYNGVIDPIADKILLLSGGKTYSLEKVETLYETKMTSNTAPAPLVASASSVFSTTYAAWKAFNGTLDAESDAWASAANVVTSWLQLDFGIPVLINNFSLGCRYHATTDTTLHAPKDFELQVSNDGIEFSTVAKFRNQTNWTKKEVRGFQAYTLGKKYRYYRLVVLTVNGGTNVNIGSLSFSYISELSELPSASEQNFIRYGANSPINTNVVFSTKAYILQDTVSENTDGLWTTKINRKPLSIKFD